MKFLLTLFCLTLTVTVQTHIFSLFPFSFPLDLILIVTYYFGYFHGKAKGMMFGAYLGIVTDVLSGELLGTQMFLKTFIGYLAAVFGQGVLSKELPTHFLLLVFFSLMNGFLNLFLINLFGGHIPFRTALGTIILPSTGWNALIGSFVLFFILNRASKQHVLSEGERLD